MARPIAEAPAQSAVLFDRCHTPVKPWTPDREHKAWANMTQVHRDETSTDRVRGGQYEARLFGGFGILDRREDEW